MALSTDIMLRVSATLTNPRDLSTADDPTSVLTQYSWTSGTAANQADLIFADTRTLGASASEDLDLAGVLTNAFGQAITFARIKAMLVRAWAANTNNVLVGGGSNPFINWISGTTPKIIVRPGGSFILVSPDVTGYAVTATTGDILTIANSSGTTGVTYDIVLIGASA